MTTAASEKPKPKKIRGDDPCPECGCPYPGDHAQDCPINNVTKLKRITEIIREYYQPEGEQEIAPETVIERIRAVTKL